MHTVYDFNFQIARDLYSIFKSFFFWHNLFSNISFILPLEEYIASLIIPADSCIPQLKEKESILNCRLCIKSPFAFVCTVLFLRLQHWEAHLVQCGTLYWFLTYLISPDCCCHCLHHSISLKRPSSYYFFFFFSTCTHTLSHPPCQTQHLHTGAEWATTRDILGYFWTSASFDYLLYWLCCHM